MRRFSTALWVVVLTTAGGCTSPQALPQEHWGPTEHGLRLAMSPTGPAASGPFAGSGWKLVFQNVSDAAFGLNLGIKLGNGQRYPTAVKLIHVNPAGQTRELALVTPPVAGRIDDWIVTLERGATHTLELKLRDFWSPATNEFSLRFDPGPQRIQARFRGEDRRHLILNEPPEDPTLTLWKGDLESNAGEFTASEVPSPKSDK